MRGGKLVKLAAAMAGVLLGVLLLLAWELRPDDQAGPCVVVNGPAMLPEIPETSGLAVSRRDSALLWSHNDSGSAAVFFALDTAGTMRGRVRVPIRTRDWEDVSAARCPSGDCLYIADIGDNRARTATGPDLSGARARTWGRGDSAAGGLQRDVRGWPAQC